MKNNRITLSDGAGGRLSHRLIKEIFLKKLGNTILNRLDDSAVLPPVPPASPEKRGERFSSLVFTSDSYIVKPIFFPGGNIGKLSVCGTVNDLAVMGAKPLYMSLSVIIEEGFELEELKKIVASIAEISRNAGVKIVCGDTKIAEKNAVDKIFITTSGVGAVDSRLALSGNNAAPGDAVILSGTIADHGIAVLNARQGLGLRGKIISDVAPLNNLVEKILKAGRVHAMRDPTRGGLAATMNEIAEQSNVGIELEEAKIPIQKPVKTACDILGLDPLYIANEGKLAAVVKFIDAQKILSAMRKHPLGKNSEIIGRITSKPKGVFLKTKIGGKRILQMLEGEQLSRIC